MMSPVSQGLAPKVFISHSSSGDPVATAFVDALRSRLREWGIDPWLDRDRLQDGLPWNDQIRLEMQRCDAAVLVVTARYLRPGAHYARDEALIFAQRAAVERFDDFQLIVLLAPDVSPEELRTADEWKNLEIHRLQVRQLATLAPEAVDQLQPFVARVLERYCSGAVPLVIREHYTDQIVKQASSAVLVQAMPGARPRAGDEGGDPAAVRQRRARRDGAGAHAARRASSPLCARGRPCCRRRCGPAWRGMRWPSAGWTTAWPAPSPQ